MANPAPAETTTTRIRLCPACAGTRIVVKAVEWPAYSAEDRENQVVLFESNCANEDCGFSFWTGDD